MSVFAQEADSYAPAQAPVEDPATQPQYVQYPNQPQDVSVQQNTPTQQYAPAQYGQPNQYPPQQQYAPVPSSLIMPRHRTPLHSRSTRLNTTSRFSMTTVSPTTRT